MYQKQLGRNGLQQRSINRGSINQLSINRQYSGQDLEIQSPVLQKIKFEDQQAITGKAINIQSPSFVKKQKTLVIGGNSFEELSNNFINYQANSQQYNSKQSQVLSINDCVEDQQPFFISKMTDNFKNKINRLLLQRVQNYICQIREIMNSIINLFKQQYRNSINEFKKIAERYIMEMEEKNKLKSIQLTPCSKCKQEQNKNKLLMQALELNKSKIERLLVENQHLNQCIFDLQQKKVGIDLEVQRRVRLQGTVPADIIVVDTKTNPITDNHIYLDTIKRLNDQIANLNAKCQRYQQICIQEDELKRNLLALQQNQSNYMRKEAQFIEVMKRNQAQININYSREHELLLAEQNWTKKIAQLKKKEAELIEWEADLRKRSSQTQNKDINNQRKPNMATDILERSQSYDLLQKSDIMSLKSFGKIEGGQNNNINPNVDRRQQSKYHALPVFQTSKVEEFSANDFRADKYFLYQKNNQYRQRQNRYQKYDKQDKIQRPYIYNQNPYFQSKSKEKTINSISNKYQISRYLPARDLSPKSKQQSIRQYPHQTMSRQYSGIRNSPNHLKEVSVRSNTSKNKKKVSNFKLNNIHNTPSPIISSVGVNRSFSGLDQKLEKLRNELKRQMDHIK